MLNDAHIKTLENLQIDLNHSSILLLIENLLFFGDINSEQKIVYVDSDYNDGDNYDFIAEFMAKNQLNDEIIRTINAHKLNWISYHPPPKPNNFNMDNDDRTISSIERV